VWFIFLTSSTFFLTRSFHLALPMYSGAKHQLGRIYRRPAVLSPVLRIQKAARRQSPVRPMGVYPLFRDPEWVYSPPLSRFVLCSACSTCPSALWSGSKSGLCLSGMPVKSFLSSGPSACSLALPARSFLSFMANSPFLF